ncbi:MAG TPA: hypothetical protein VFE33_07465 [Thermoanaerobaculia bacterium]|nr:hypothetical protein [Thermoanaerobaculia bacterium]
MRKAILLLLTLSLLAVAAEGQVSRSCNNCTCTTPCSRICWAGTFITCGAWGVCSGQCLAATEAAVEGPASSSLPAAAPVCAGQPAAGDVGLAAIFARGEALSQQLVAGDPHEQRSGH